MAFATLADRLRTAMNEAGVTQSQLAEMTGVTQGAIQKLVSGKAKSTRKLMDIATALNVNPHWLANGAGEMKHDKRSEIPPKEEWEGVSTWDSRTPLDEDEVEVPFLKDIDFACGDGSYNEDDYNGFKIRFSKATLRRMGVMPENVICFPARGTSMEPIIPDGSTVAVDCGNKKIVDGKIYAISQDGWKRIKVLHQSGPDKVTIRSYNHDEYPDESTEINNVEVIGRVFWTSVLFS